MNKIKILPIIITSIFTAAWLVCWGMILFYPKADETTHERITAEKESEISSESETSEQAEGGSTDTAYSENECEDIITGLKNNGSRTDEQKADLMQKADDVVRADACQLNGDGVLLYEDSGAQEGYDNYKIYSCNVLTDNEYYLVTAPFFDISYGSDSAQPAGYADVLFKKQGDAFEGIYACTYSERKYIESAYASSVLDPEYGKTYEASNLIDGNYDTAWVEGEDGVGTGVTITLNLPQETEVYGLLIYNGYLVSTDLYNKNGKVTRVQVDFGNGVTKTETIPVKSVNASDTEISESDYSIGRVSPEESVVTDTIKITILDAESGYRYSDTCISEMKIY